MVSIVLVILFGLVLCTTNVAAGGIMGSVGATVNISTTLTSTDLACTLSSSTPGLITNSICSLAGENVEASFVVGNVPAGAYLIQVTGDSGDFAIVSFIVL